MLRELCEQYQKNDSVAERLKLETQIVEMVMKFVAETNTFREKYKSYTGYYFLDNYDGDGDDEYKISFINDSFVEITREQREPFEPFSISFDEFELFTSHPEDYKNNLIDVRMRQLSQESQVLEEKLERNLDEMEKLVNEKFA
jgi:hypothetical protein